MIIVFTKFSQNVNNYHIILIKAYIDDARACAYKKSSCHVGRGIAALKRLSNVHEIKADDLRPPFINCHSILSHCVKFLCQTRLFVCGRVFLVNALAHCAVDE